MEKYQKPEMKLEEYHPVDVLTTSGGGGGSEEPTTQSYTTPYIPIP